MESARRGSLDWRFYGVVHASRHRCRCIRHIMGTWNPAQHCSVDTIIFGGGQTKISRSILTEREHELVGLTPLVLATQNKQSASTQHHLELALAQQ